jgi:hypothetical protein
MGGEKVRCLVIFYLLFVLSLFSQTLYFSPKGDLALTVYDPFVVMEVTNINEIGLFRIPESSCTLQVLSVQLSKPGDLRDLVELIKIPSASESSIGLFKLDDLDIFVRKISIITPQISTAGLQVIFTRERRVYIMTYYASEKEFFEHIVPALLTMTSIKTNSLKQRYVNNEYGYSIYLAEPFKIVKTTRGEIGSFLAVKEKRVGYIQITKEQPGRSVNLLEYAELVQQNSLENLAGYNLLASGVNLVEGFDFFWRLFQFDSKGSFYRCLQVYTNYGQFFYTLTYMAEADDFDQFIVPAVRTVFSFKPK